MMKVTGCSGGTLLPIDLIGVYHALDTPGVIASPSEDRDIFAPAPGCIYWYTENRLLMRPDNDM